MTVVTSGFAAASHLELRIGGAAALSSVPASVFSSYTPEKKGRASESIEQSLVNRCAGTGGINSPRVCGHGGN